MNQRSNVIFAFLKCPDFNKKILRTKFYIQIRIFMQFMNFSLENIYSTNIFHVLPKGR